MNDYAAIIILLMSTVMATFGVFTGMVPDIFTYLGNVVGSFIIIYMFYFIVAKIIGRVKSPS